MYYVDDFLKSINAAERLPGYNVNGTQSSGVIDGPDYRVSIYANPENTVTLSDKISGLYKILKFGINGAEELKDRVETIVGMLESNGY